jgi:hypothetical protein
MVDNYTFNIVAIIVSVCSLIFYNLYAYSFGFKMKFSRETLIYNPSEFQMIWPISFLWIERQTVKGDASNIQLAIHTYRNSIIVVIIFGILTIQTFATVLNSYNLQNSYAQKVRIIILITLLISSFLCWSSYARCVSHLGYQTGVLSSMYEQFKKKSIYNEEMTLEEVIVLEENSYNTNKNDTTSIGNSNNGDCGNGLSMSQLFENMSHLMTVMMISFR